MIKTKRVSVVAALGLAAVTLLACTQPYRQSRGLGPASSNVQQQPTYDNGYVDRKTNRQVRRQQRRANSRIARETDRAVDRGVNKVLNGIFD